MPELFYSELWYGAQCKKLLKGSGKNSITWKGQLKSRKNELYSMSLNLSFHYASGIDTQLIHLCVFANFLKFHLGHCFPPLRQIGLRTFEYKLISFTDKIETVTYIFS